MLTNRNQKYKLSNFVKDLTDADRNQFKCKDLADMLTENGFPAHNSSTVLEDDEFNFLMDALSKENQTADFDKYLNGESRISVSYGASGDAAAKPVKNQGAADGQSDGKKNAGTAEVRTPEKDSDKEKSEKTAEPEKAEKSKGGGTDTSGGLNPAAADADKSGNRNPENKTDGHADSVRAGGNKDGSEKAVKAVRPEKTDHDNSDSPNPSGPRKENTADSPVKSQNQKQSEHIKNENPGSSKQPAEKQNKEQDNKSEKMTEIKDKETKGTNEQQRIQTGSDNNQKRRPEQEKSSGESKTGAAKHNARFDQKPKFSDKPDDSRKSRASRQKQHPSEQPRPSVAPTLAAEPSGRIVADSSGRGNRLHGGRVADTRASSVDLSKYDERLETLVPEHARDVSGEKQKLKKQNNRQRGAENEHEHINHGKVKKHENEKPVKQQLSITIPDEIAVGELAQRLKVTAAEVIKKLIGYGVMANVTQVIDYDTAALVAMELGAKVTKEVVVTIENKLFDESEDDSASLVERAPVVCVMGHVDHGKTSLLDAIRNTNVTSGEAGGITQAIGAYRVKVGDKNITFLDTPGHEAFTAMRARGAQATDIAILVVAADDGIMPQTVEAINHAKAAGIDIIVAINKMDKHGANPNEIKQELTKYDLIPEEWGGDVMCVPISALTHMGIDELLEDVLLVAEVKELKANPKRRAKGVVIESRLDKGRGPIATVLVQNGTLHSGDVVIAGTAVGRVRAMTDDKGRSVKKAGPSVPVEIIGLSEVPEAGDEFNAVEDEKMARELAEQRREKRREKELNSTAKVNLDDLFAQISSGQKELNIIVKADVDGSAEAVKQSLEKLTNDEVKVNIIHAGVGGITEGDVMFAAASNALIVGFNVRPDKGALDSAERQKVDIRTYRVIYECIEEIDAAMKGLLAPKFRENLLGHIEVRQTIHVPDVGTIAGSYVQDGKVTRSSNIRVVRDGIVIFEDEISSLRRFKDDVKEVAQGFECGIGLSKFNDIKVGDILEAFEMVQVKPD